MGWCIEFGPRIEHNCEQAMVAGSSQCSCASCGAVCTGRFDGCAKVWAQGPQDVTLPATPLPSRMAARLPAPPSGKVAVKVAENGHSASRRDAEASRAVVAELAAPAAESVALAAPAAESVALAGLASDGVAVGLLLAELRGLQSRMEQVHATWMSGVRDEDSLRVAELILSEFHALPTRIAGAMSAALQEQHRAIMTEVRSALREAIAEFKIPS